LSAWAVTRLAGWSLRKTEFFILWPPSATQSLVWRF